MTARAAVIVNQGAGSAAAHRLAELRRLVAAAGPELQLVTAAPADVHAAAEAAADLGCTALVAAGGDGTANAVARVAVARGLTFGVIPFGTLNHFAGDAGLPDDLEAAVAVVTAGHTRRIDYASAGERIFLNTASIGLYPAFVRRRARHARLGKWPAAAIELWGILTGPIRAGVYAIKSDGVQHRLRTAFIFIGNNDYHLDAAGRGTRDTLTGGRLGLYALRYRGRHTLVMGVLRSLAGRTDHPDILKLSTTQLTIGAAKPSADVALDGEVHRLALPLDIKIHPRGLRLLVPKS